jgi:hypothetical protein
LASEFVAKVHGRHVDPLKASTVYEETAEGLSGALNRQVQAKSLFMYANQYGESLKARLQDDQCTGRDREHAKAKADLLERALRVKSVDYLKELVPINTNIAQHALFSAKPKNTIGQTAELPSKELEAFISKVRAAKHSSPMMPAYNGSDSKFMV